MKAPSLRGLSIEDFRNLTPDVRKGLEQLSAVLSPFLADTTDALAGGLTLGNLDAIIKTVEVTTPAAATPPPAFTSGTLENTPAGITANNVTIYRDGPRVFYDGYLITSGNAATISLGTVPAEFRPTMGNFRTEALLSNNAVTQYRGYPLLITTAGVATIRDYVSTVAVPNLGSDPYVFLTGVSYFDPTYVAPPEPSPPNPEPSPFTVSLESSGRRLKSGRPSIVIPVGATEVSGTRATEVVVPTIAWEHTKDGVVVKKIRGLDPGKRYHLTLLIAS